MVHDFFTKSGIKKIWTYGWIFEPGTNKLVEKVRIQQGSGLQGNVVFSLDLVENTHDDQDIDIKMKFMIWTSN